MIIKQILLFPFSSVSQCCAVLMHMILIFELSNLSNYGVSATASMGQKILAPQHGNRLGSSWLVSAISTNKWIGNKKTRSLTLLLLSPNSRSKSSPRLSSWLTHLNVFKQPILVNYSLDRLQGKFCSRLGLKKHTHLIRETLVASLFILLFLEFQVSSWVIQKWTCQQGIDNFLQCFLLD